LEAVERKKGKRDRGQLVPVSAVRASVVAWAGVVTRRRRAWLAAR
jgi:hypothetical protein